MDQMILLTNVCDDGYDFYNVIHKNATHNNNNNNKIGIHLLVIQIQIRKSEVKWRRGCDVFSEVSLG